MQNVSKQLHQFLSGKTQHQRRVLLMLLISIAFFLILVILRLIGAWLLHHRTLAEAIPRVSTVTAVSAPAQEDIILPGTVSAWHVAPIYARTNGYIQRWYVDIGDHVKKGQLLALIETPELDAQLRQAEADVKVLRARDKLAQITAVRWKNLRKTDSVSQQETDEKVNMADATHAELQASMANRDRLRELVNFERVVAPFTGVISDRGIDIGSLINAGNAPNQPVRLFQIVLLNKLRVYIKIPQLYVEKITPDMHVTLQFQEHPGKVYDAHLLGSAHAVATETRTLLTEFVIDNKDVSLLPGSYTEVHFSMPRISKMVRLPVNTLLFRKEGLQVASVDDAQRVHLKSVTVSRDFGNFVEIAAGIDPGEKIILNPSDSIADQDRVRVTEQLGDLTHGQAINVKNT